MIRLLALSLLFLHQTDTKTARVEIETFAPSRAYAVGTDAVTLTATVRNNGTADAEPMQLELHALTGLEYLSGDTRPKSPALKPGERCTFSWRLKPSETTGPLVAALAVQNNFISPASLRVLAIQHLERPPSEPGAGSSPLPSARRIGSGAVLENDRVRVRVFDTSSEVVMATLSVRTAAGWKRMGTSGTLLDLLTSEPGQIGWWESMKVESIRANEFLDSAVLTVSGSVGVRWRATAELLVRKDSGAVDMRFQLSPRRPVRLEGVRCSVMLAGDGSFGAASSEILPPTLDAQVVRAGLRFGSVAVGAAWRPPNRGSWRAEAVPNPIGAEYTTLGSELAALQPLEFSAGGTLEMRTRWMVFPAASDLTAAGQLPISESLIYSPKPRPSAATSTSRKGRSLRQKRGKAAAARRTSAKSKSIRKGSSAKRGKTKASKAKRPRRKR